MGDRYYTEATCPYCGAMNDDIYYAPTSGFMTFVCDNCNKESFIDFEMEPMKLEKVTLQDVKDVIETSSNFMNERQIEECAQFFYKSIKNKKMKGG